MRCVNRNDLDYLQYKTIVAATTSLSTTILIFFQIFKYLEPYFDKCYGVPYHRSIEIKDSTLDYMAP